MCRPQGVVKGGGEDNGILIRPSQFGLKRMRGCEESVGRALRKK